MKFSRFRPPSPDWEWDSAGMQLIHLPTRTRIADETIDDKPVVPSSLPKVRRHRNKGKDTRHETCTNDVH